MVTVDLKTKDPPDMLTRTVTAFFEELLVKEVIQESTPDNLLTF